MRFSNFLILSEYAQGMSDLATRYLQGQIKPEDFEALTRSNYVQRNMDLWRSNTQGGFSPRFQQWKEWYNNIKQQLISSMEKIGWINDENPGWFQFSLPKQNRDKIDGKTFKLYYSVDVKDCANFVQNLPSLANNLSQVNTQNQLSFKIPSTYSTFMTERDSLVVHFYDKQANQEINQAVISFFQNAGVTPQDRRKIYQTTDHGVDLDGKSDTQLVVQKFMQFIDHNKQYLLDLQKRDPSKFTKDLDQLWQHISQKGYHR
jgi:hypothetical protein